MQILSLHRIFIMGKQSWLEDFLLSNLEEDEGLFIEQFEEELNGQAIEGGDWRGVDGALDGVPQLF